MQSARRIHVAADKHDEEMKNIAVAGGEAPAPPSPRRNAGAASYSSAPTVRAVPGLADVDMHPAPAPAAPKLVGLAQYPEEGQKSYRAINTADDGGMVEIAMPSSSADFDFPERIPPPRRRWIEGPVGKWPHHLDNTVIRLRAGMIMLVAITLLVAGWHYRWEAEHVLTELKGVWYVLIVQEVDFLLCVTLGQLPYSPYALIANAVLWALRVPPQPTGSSCKRLAFLLALIMNTVVLGVRFGAPGKMFPFPLVMMSLGGGLAAFFDICVGCYYFRWYHATRRWIITRRKKRALRREVPTRIARDNEPTWQHGYQYDLIVIGGGSGGLAAAKEAAKLNQHVAILDFVTPSPQGTKWGLGGTCVNVGCIPKKLYHTAAIMGEHILHNAAAYGWRGCAMTPDHSWPALRERIGAHIASLNKGYETALGKAKVQYINARGRFLDRHTVECTFANGSKMSITGRRVLIAVGGRPKFPSDCPGAREYGISSDDIFWLEKSPGKTLVVGASYIALESAGFLRGLGLDTTVMARGEFLRGFDKDMAKRIVQNMRIEGVKFVQGAVPSSISRDAAGALTVTWKASSGGGGGGKAGKGGPSSTGAPEEGREVFDTVLFAIGREPAIGELNLSAIGVQVNKESGKILVDKYEQTSAPGVYAIGDVIHGGIELTPVAIQAGILLARRLYGNSTRRMHYSMIPTTILVNYEDRGRIVGFHYLGPNAGEVTQGFATAFLKGMTYDEWLGTTGIHPTAPARPTRPGPPRPPRPALPRLASTSFPPSKLTGSGWLEQAAEEMVLLKRSKRSGEDARKTGC
eukprot:tig00020693_g13017.t1